MKTKKTNPALAVDLPRLVENRGGVWMMSGKPCQSCAREIAKSAMVALSIDPADFRKRDKIIVAIAPKVEAMMNAARTQIDQAQQRATSDEPSTENATGALAAAPCSYTVDECLEWAFTDNMKWMPRTEQSMRALAAEVMRLRAILPPNDQAAR